MTRLASILQRGVDERVFPGAQAAVSREGRTILEIEVGRRGPGLEPVSPGVLYDLASLTKALGTCAVWAHQWERGRVDPADRLATRFPGADPRIEHRHLLRHTSGLPAHQRFDRRLPHHAASGSAAARAWIARAAAETPTDRPPGETARYSDLGFIALGSVLETLGGASLGSQLRGLGSPLIEPSPASDLRTLRWAPTGREPPGRVHDDNAVAMGGLAGHAGLFGSARQVISWVERWLAAYHGSRAAPWSPETVRGLWRVRPGPVWTWGWDRPTPDGTTGGAWPESSVGHLGYTGTAVWIHPETGIAAVLLTNRTAVGGRIEALRHVRQAFFREAWSLARSAPRLPGTGATAPGPGSPADG